MGNDDAIECDVAVIGAGLAGTALATSLAREGLAVTCIEPRPETRGRVGESLDWSAPALLADLGFDRERLVREGYGTHKRVVRVRPDDGAPFELAPRPWCAARPLSLERVTLHLDRERFDRACLEAARRAGVRFRWERVSRVLTEGERVTGLETPSARVRARRYVDASGRARLLAHAFSIPADREGPPKVTLWTHLPGEGPAAATTLTLEGDGYLRWLWEIPIAPEVVSVGLTLAATELKARAAEAGGLEPLLRRELARHPHLRDRLPARLEVRTCSFQSRVQRRASGPNWLLVGEAAALIDPLTANGFSAALRSGAHAARLITETIERPVLARSGRRLYDGCVRAMASAFNRHVERVAYEPRLRRHLGTERTTRIYVLFGYFANAAYQKLHPRGRVSWGLLRLTLAGFEAWFGAWSLAARLLPARPPRPPVPPPPTAPRAQDVEAVAAALPARGGSPREPATTRRDDR